MMTSRWIVRVVVSVVSVLLMGISGVAGGETLDATADTFVDAWYNNTNNGSLSVVKIREFSELEGLVRFDLSGVPGGSYVGSATLRLYYYGYTDGDPVGRSVSVTRATSSWSESTVTWNTRPSGAGTATDTVAMPSSYGWVEWDVSSDVAAMADGTFSNHGWYIRDESTGNEMSRFYSREDTVTGYGPELVISYTLPGSGTEADPWLIDSEEAFEVFSGDSGYWDDYTRLETDLALGLYGSAPISPDTDQGSIGYQGTAFTGEFDGNGHVITSLEIDQDYPSADYDYVGLFGMIETAGVVKDLSLGSLPYMGAGYPMIDISVYTGQTPSYIGALAGYNRGTIERCHAVARVMAGETADNIGGLIGYNYGNVTGCSSYGEVEGGPDGSYIGGLIGRNNTGNASRIVTYCHSGSKVRGNGSGGNPSSNVGGLIGGNRASIVKYCYAWGDVTGTPGYYPNQVGGLTGYNGFSSSVQDCYARGSVEGTDYVGGLIGWHTNSGLYRSYSTGPVSGSSSVGGLIGDADDVDPDVYDCYWDTDTSNRSSSDGGTGKDTEVMKRSATFGGWDFEGVWQIHQGQGYPMIRFYNRADLNKDGVVDLSDLQVMAANWLVLGP